MCQHVNCPQCLAHDYMHRKDQPYREARDCDYKMNLMRKQNHLCLQLLYVERWCVQPLLIL